MSCGRVFNTCSVRASTWWRIWGKADDVTKAYTAFLHKPRFYSKWQVPVLHEQQQSQFSRHSSLQFHNCDIPFHPLFVPVWTSVSQRTSYSTKSNSTRENETQKATAAGPAETEQKLSIFQRFKKTYKEHGKILITVHLVTSTVWFGSFYVAARCGIDIVPYLEHWGFSETIIKQFKSGGLGDIALAYLMYKLATPARYTVTIAGTNFAIRYLRRTGRMPPKSQEHSLRELYKEGKSRLRTSSLRIERLQRLRAAREKKKQEIFKKLNKK